ncbi:MAG: SdpI family protein [Caldilineales bacterium]|nr:SdpI family protein [Caldilineales bacterium]MDW8316506.1 SdpI family protein [Anaerolineae bacterium]
MLFLTVFYVVAGLGLVLLALPLIKRKAKPNVLYGFRVPQTLNNPALWYEVNAYFGRWLLASGAATVLAAVALYPAKLSVDAYAWAVLVAFAVVFVPGLVLSWRHMNRWAKSTTP